MAANLYVFDSKNGGYVPNPELDNDAPKISVAFDAEDVIVDPLEDYIDEQPGGTGTETLLPPNSFYVSEQIVRNNPDGSTTVDIIIEVDDDGSRQYEVRVTQ